ncbi:MAG: hypothetical protein JRF06_08195 [Deltaproteobacteria bacterium]|nr:hypothetical protein [Deltaproteobacteria bacterium]
MIRRLLLNKNMLIFFFFPLFFYLFFNAFHRVAIAKPNSAKILLNKAEACTKKLYQSKAKKKYRHNWERCIKRYEKTYKTFPGTYSLRVNYGPISMVIQEGILI